ncbi:MAG: hypothetical protein ACYDBJ_04470 [Aggregatilineales bacterium]
MSDVAITIKLPQSLVEQAKVVGLNIEAETDMWVGAVEKEIRRSEAGKRLREIAEKMHELPDEGKPTEEEIVQMVKRARRELAAAQEAYDQVLEAASKETA